MCACVCVCVCVSARVCVHNLIYYLISISYLLSILSTAYCYVEIYRHYCSNYFSFTHAISMSFRLRCLYWYACYRFVDTSVTWSEVDQSCRNDGAYLVSVYSEPKNAAVFAYADSRLPKWLGLKMVRLTRFAVKVLQLVIILGLK